MNKLSLIELISKFMKTNNLRNLPIENSKDTQSYWGLLCEIHYGLNNSQRIIEMQNFYMDNLPEILLHIKNDFNFNSDNQGATVDLNNHLPSNILEKNHIIIFLSFDEWQNLKEAFVSGKYIYF
jgi:hypothetical protein